MADSSEETDGLYSFEEDNTLDLLADFQFNEEPAKPNNGETLDIHGVQIQFPYKAYESQVQMMTHILAGVKTGENCLLESPTGTGKTAAILCSLLAWQKKCKSEGAKYWKIESPTDCSTCTCNFDYPDAVVVVVPDMKNKDNFDLHRNAVEDDDFDDPGPGNECGEDDCESSPTKKGRVTIIPAETRTRDTVCGSCLKKFLHESNVPRIYYATRTHSQIAQVIKQLKQTSYSAVPMTILSSRQYTCINESSRNALPRSGLDDRCNKLKKNYYKNQNSASAKERPTCSNYKGDVFQSDFLPERNNVVWDIEDIVAHGKIAEECPFFNCRQLHRSADIVFLPYNYLLDQSIRDSTKIKFPNSILVFDEAHNIEQICCDSLTIEIPLELLNDMRAAFDKLLIDHQDGRRKMSEDLISTVQTLSNRLFILSNWIKREGEALPNKKAFDGTTEGSKTFSGDTLIEVLQTLRSGPSDITALDGILHDLRKSDDNGKAKLSFLSVQTRFLEEFVGVIKTIYANDMKRLPDFRATLEKKSTGTVKPLVFNYTFSIVCLNAGIAFELLRQSARTIIVTSGTLSPTISFATELETNFQQVLSADHVIGSSQICAGVLSNGLSHNLDMLLNASCLANNEIILDDLGQIVVDICRRVPNGVLVFLPSYKSMERLKTQWGVRRGRQAISILDQLKTCKKVFYEESGREKIEIFKESMKRYQKEVLVGNGAILFAVFRGKVSEGVDFKDEQARAVVTIGIPYPYQGLRINLKKQYNDIRMRSEPYLSGQEWYTAQAFRAMNQAFGRCLRHRGDWGALLLIDSRIQHNKKNLSGWVVKFLRKHNSAIQCMKSLEQFMNNKISEAIPITQGFVPPTHSSELDTQLIRAGHPLLSQDQATLPLTDDEDELGDSDTTQPMDVLPMTDDED